MNRQPRDASVHVYSDCSPTMSIPRVCSQCANATGYANQPTENLSDILLIFAGYISSPRGQVQLLTNLSHKPLDVLLGRVRDVHSIQYTLANAFYGRASRGDRSIRIVFGLRQGVVEIMSDRIHVQCIRLFRQSRGSDRVCTQSHQLVTVSDSLKLVAIVPEALIQVFDDSIKSFRLVQEVAWISDGFDHPDDSCVAFRLLILFSKTVAHRRHTRSEDEDLHSEVAEEPLQLRASPVQTNGRLSTTT